MAERPGRYRNAIVPHTYVDGASDAIAFYKKAFGATQIQLSADMFCGANSASVRDPFGHVWALLSWKEDIDPAEIERRGSALLGVS